LKQHVISHLARSCPSFTDDVWLVDSTPIECGRSRETVKRSDLAGWAEYGYCASHSRFLWGLRPHLIATPSGLPVAYALTGAKAELADAGITLIRPNLKSEEPRPGRHYLKAFRQIIESVNQTFKAQLDLERHGGRTRPGVGARILQRILALTTATWHNETTNQPGPARSLTVYDH